MHPFAYFKLSIGKISFSSRHLSQFNKIRFREFPRNRKGCRSPLNCEKSRDISSELSKFADAGEDGARAGREGRDHYTNGGGSLHLICFPPNDRRLMRIKVFMEGPIIGPS